MPCDATGPNMPTEPGQRRAFWTALLANAIWINASEIFRYFVFVMPMMREAFPQIDDVAPMNFGVFMIWGAWDTLLLFAATGVTWLMLVQFGSGIRNAVLAGTAVWAGIFGILWLGLFNMNLATGAVLAVALPLAWLEMVVAALLVRWRLLAAQA